MKKLKMSRKNMTIIGAVGAGLVGYWLWKKYKGSSSTATPMLQPQQRQAIASRQIVYNPATRSYQYQ